MHYLNRIFLTAVALLFATDQVAAQQLAPSFHMPVEGYSQPGRIAEVAASTKGILKTNTCTEGDTVSKGQCIGEIDSTVHDKLVEMARVAMLSSGEAESAQAEFEARQSMLRRVQGLVGRQHASQVELLKAEEQLAIAQANLSIVKEKSQARKAEYEKLVAESSQYRVRAPFNGVIVKLLKEEGEYIGPADPNVCVIAQLDQLVVEFLVPRERREEVKLGSEANVRFVASDQLAAGRVSYVSPYPNGETNLYTVKINIDNQSRTYEAGMRCQLVSKAKVDSIAQSNPATSTRQPVNKLFAQ